MIRNCNIEIIISNYSGYLESFVQSWNSNDLFLTMSYDNFEQRIFSAYSPHIENIKTEKELIKRILSLNILLNGTLFITNAETLSKIEFTNYNIENKEFDQTIEKNNISGFWTDTIEEHPFEQEEDFYLKEENRNLPKKADLDVMLFGISKFDYIIKTLLFQAGIRPI